VTGKHRKRHETGTCDRLA